MYVSKELIIDVSTTGITIALLEEKRLVELHKEKTDSRFSVGNIYLGKVKKIMPGLNAAFVDVGFEKDAFLHYQDLGPQYNSLNKYLKNCLTQKGRGNSINRFKNEPDIDKNGKISDVLETGQSIIVQITKEPISTKGPRLTSEISLAGRNMVVMPFYDKVSISQKIQEHSERDRLRTMLQGIKPKNYGIIVRTVAEKRKTGVFDSELRSLVKKWESTLDNIKDGKTPRLILSEIDRVSTLLRDLFNDSFTNIIVNDELVCQEIKDYLSLHAPDKEKIVKFYDADAPLYEFLGIDKQIKALFGKVISVRTGAYLIIEHTEAMHTIDVNSGNKSKSSKDQESNALDTNLAACTEIARQLRLRDMGGIICVDFIDMQLGENKHKVFEKLKEAMLTDRAKHNILPLSKFGIMQITRQRVRPEMNINTMEKCPACKGSGEISPSILFVDEIELKIPAIISKLGSDFTLKVHPYIKSHITKGGLFSIRMKWFLKFKKFISIKESQSFHFTEYYFVDGKGEAQKV